MSQKQRDIMPVVVSTSDCCVSNISKGTSRSRSSQRTLTSKSSRFFNRDQQTSPITHPKKTINKMATNDNLPTLPRPPDPTLFIRAGTSGVRHLFPIHLSDPHRHGSLFSRSISRLRARTPSTDLCTNVEMIRNICSSIQTLEHFDISENDLHELPLDICSLLHLQTFNCSHNHLSKIADLFEQLNQLKDLDLSYNHFKYLPSVIYTFKQLLRLNCEHNSLKKLDRNLLNLQHLKSLILDHNQLQELDTIDFSHLKRLEYLHAAHNQLTKFPDNLQKLLHLKNVNLSNNHLTIFPVDLLLINTLDVLNLSHNSFTNLPPLADTYKRTSLIFSIDLSYNQLTKFYDYLFFISLKLDLSNNQIQSISNDVIRKLNHQTMTNRELKLSNNPLKEPFIPSDLLNDNNTNAYNILPIFRSCLNEQQMNEIARQGFKICITGGKQSGKSSLAYCLEGSRACLPTSEKDERMINILQYPFRFETSSHHSSASAILVQSPKAKQRQSEIDASKRKKLSVLPSVSSLPVEPIKSLPLSIFDLNGSSEYYEHMSPFIDTNAVHLVCVHSADFNQTTPANIEDIFEKTFDPTPYPMLTQLFQILQLLCEKVTKTNGIVIIPIATYIDLYDQRSKEDKNLAINKINRFFKLYLQFRLDRIKDEIQQINSLPTISSSLSYRLKIYTSLLNINIQIESCQPISSLTYQGIQDLNQTIQNCLRTHRTIFAHVDRILPTLWIDANRYIESLADHLPVPYLLWENFINHIINKHGLANLIDDITRSLSDEGKLLVLNEIGTTNRVVFLRPLWLGDLITSLFHITDHSESQYPSYHKEYHQYGRLHSDLVRSLWMNLLHKKEYFYQLWIILMRFLLIAYPKMSKKPLKNLLVVDEKSNVKFDYAIVPSYLPFMNSTNREKKRRYFDKELLNRVSICYTSSMLPLGFVHRYSVSAIWKLSIIYREHWNNFLLGEFDGMEVKFMIETDHQKYVHCHCGTSISDQPFEHIWNGLMLLLDHFEEMFRVLAPNNQFNRHVRCPACNEYSFMGEWTTPKELQGLKVKVCSACGESIDTYYLVQPNDNKRRNEELLRRIRERKANNNNNMNRNFTSPTTTTNVNQLLTSSV